VQRALAVLTVGAFVVLAVNVLGRAGPIMLSALAVDDDS
jgi:hypothetical protein